jgi:hypothetical protein
MSGCPKIHFQLLPPQRRHPCCRNATTHRPHLPLPTRAAAAFAHPPARPRRHPLGGPRPPPPAHLLGHRWMTSAVMHTTMGGPHRRRYAGAPMPPGVTAPEPALHLASPELLPCQSPHASPELLPRQGYRRPTFF